jgi:hypothetical protein
MRVLMSQVYQFVIISGSFASLRSTYDSRQQLVRQLQ